jgi:hypothetical protein
MKPAPSPSPNQRPNGALRTSVAAAGFGLLLLALPWALQPFTPSPSQPKAPVESGAGPLAGSESSTSTEPGLGHPASPTPKSRSSAPRPASTLSLLPLRGPVQGTRLQPSPGGSVTDKGRFASIDRSQLPAWKHLKAGDRVSLPGFEDSPVEGTLHLVTQDNGWLRMGGTLPGNQGTFYLSTNFDEVSGAIHHTDTGLALARPATIPRARVAETGQKRIPII